MKKIIFSSSIFAILIIASTSCKKSFTDIQPIGQQVTSAYFINEGQAEAALTTVYDVLQPDSYYGYDINSLTEAVSDNTLAGGDDPALFSIDAFTTNPTNPTIKRNFQQMFLGVARANFCIDNVGAMDLGKFNFPESKIRILGEARFLRALDYFNLVRLYGPVPLSLKQTTSIKPEDINLPNSTVDAIYTQAIIPDLQYAIENLSVNQAVGRATKGAALGLLAKVYLTRGDFANAALLAQQVKTLNKYILLPNYDDLFQSKNTREGLFEIQFASGNGEGTPYPNLVLPCSKTTFCYKKFHTPTTDLANAYEANDTRKNASIFYEREFNNNANPIIPYIYKFRFDNGFDGAANFPVLRYADILLMEAEALNETNYPSAIALTDLQTIRTRAGVSNAAINFTVLNTKDKFRDAVLKERRVELAFEGQRWFDLLRTGRALSTMQLFYPNILPKNLLYPMPQSERDRNPNLAQNVGYN
jgi:starch-binding outer membrane protein, SusD/RagB family